MIQPRLRRTILEAGVSAAMVALVLLSTIPKASTALFTWPWIFYGQLLLIIPIVVLGIQLMRGPESWRRDWNVIGAISVAVAVSVIFSRRPAFSCEAALFLWSGLAWCGVVAMTVNRHWDLSAFTDTQIRSALRISGFAVLAPLLASAAYWSNDLANSASTSGWWHVLSNLSSHRNPHPLGHWNYTGGYALLALPWLVALTWAEHGRWRLLWVLTCVLGIVVLLSASSRGAVLGLVTSLAAAIGLALASRRLPLRTFAMLITVGISLMAGLAATNPRLRALVTDPGSAASPNEGDVQRIAMLQGGWLLARERPLIGHGPGMTPFVYPEIRAQLVGGVETSYQLHNGPLQIAVDSGLLGFVCWGAMGLLLARGSLRWLQTSASGSCGTMRNFALCSTCGLAGYAVFFLTDYQLDVIAILAVLGLQAGVVVAAPANRSELRKTPSYLKWWGVVIIAGAVASLIVLVPAWRAHQAFWAAWWEVSSVNDPMVSHHLRRAASLAPKNPHYLNYLGFRLATDADAAVDKVIASTLRTEARDTLARSLTLDHAQEPVHAALGWLWLNEDPQRAERHFRAALALLPDRETLHLGLALCLLAQDRRSESARELILECLLNPRFLASHLWTQEPLAGLRSAVAENLPGIYGMLVNDSSLPARLKPQLQYAAGFTRWWFGGDIPDVEELAGASATQRAAFEIVSQRGNARPQLAPAIRDLLDAYNQPGSAEQVLSGGSPERSDSAIAGALARLASAHGDFLQMLRSPAPARVGVIQQRITRGHFAIMHRIMEGPGYTDFAPRRFDAFTLEFVGALFPARVALPGPAIRTLIAAP